MSPGQSGTQSGFLMPAAAMGLAAFALVVVAASLVVSAAGRDVSTIAREHAAREKALEAIQRVLQLLEADPTPEASSFHDPVWGKLSANVRLRELLPNPAGANVNRASKARLEAIAVGRLPAHVPPARALRKVYQARAAGELLTPDSLKLALKAHYRQLAPAITAAPEVNVNTAGEKKLRSLLKELLPAGRVSAAVDRILAAREKRELTPDELPALAPGADEATLRGTLGVRSKAYLIEIEEGGYTFEAVLVRRGATGEFALARFRELRS